LERVSEEILVHNLYTVTVLSNDFIGYNINGARLVSLSNFNSCWRCMESSRYTN